MRYKNPRFTYLLTNLLQWISGRCAMCMEWFPSSVTDVVPSGYTPAPPKSSGLGLPSVLRQLSSDDLRPVEWTRPLLKHLQWLAM